MAINEGGNKEFLELLKSAPTLDEAASGETVELTGLVARSGDGKFAITTGEGQTYELDPAAVTRFRAEAGPGLSRAVTVQISAEALKAAVLRPIKPLIKDMIKDPIKDMISDGGGTLHGKDIQTDPITDKSLPKDIHTDPIADKHFPKDVRTDPIVDKPIHKDIRKDPIQDPIDTGWADAVGKPVGDPGNIPDPAGQVTNPAFAAAGFAAGATPFVMQTPHHAASHLVAQQMGGAQAAFGAPQFKPALHDTIKEIARAETIKEPVFDTYKEMIWDTRKEMVWDTYIEGGPYTLQEGTFDPGQIAGGPIPVPWAGAAAGGFGGFM
jgi:hypothetical protein